MPSENERERFTFDDVTKATDSKCYIEGVYVGEALTDIKYVGCMSTSGSKVQETSVGGVKIQFEFKDFTDDKGNVIGFNKMQQWHMEASQSTWTRNSEFKPSEAIVTTEERKTAVVMLVLDCSSSLGSDLAKVKSAASDFIKVLAGDDNSGSGNNSGVGNSAQIRFRKEAAYTRVLAMAVEEKVGGDYNAVAGYSFGTDAGTSEYYEIPAGSLYPSYYYKGDTDEETGWIYAFGDPHTYSFVAGKKYTFNCGDDGQYLEITIILDGTANAPAKVVAQKRILKSNMSIYKK